MTNYMDELSLKESELPSVYINELVQYLSDMYSQLINNNIPLSTFPSVMLWGQPGVGKSQAIKQIANRITESTKKRVVVNDVRLLLFNPIDLRGIPVADKEKNNAIWLKPYIFQMSDDKDVINILFLDEITAAPQSVQAAAYQITLDRTIGEHKLPPNTIVISAGNRISDKSVANKMPKALANRLLHFEIESDFDNWKSWAIQNNINKKVIGFLSFKPELLNCFDPKKDSTAFPTPRTWEMVSNVLNYCSSSEESTLAFISGLIGSGTALEFRSWVNVYNELPKMEDIFAGNETREFKNASILYALTSSMVEYVKKTKTDLKGIENSLNYALTFPKDYTMLLFEEYMMIDNKIEEFVLNNPTSRRWILDNAPDYFELQK